MSRELRDPHETPEPLSVRVPPEVVHVPPGAAVVSWNAHPRHVSDSA